MNLMYNDVDLNSDIYFGYRWDVDWDDLSKIVMWC